MLKKLNCYLARVSVFLILAALIAVIVGCDSYNPSEDIEIRTWYDLDAVRDNLAGHHTLMNSLDSTTAGYTALASPTANGGHGWQPIGAWGYRFAGSFDGQDYEIRDLFIAQPDDDSTVDDDWVGLFSVVDGTGVVRNVGVVNADVLGSRCVGALIGQNRGNVVNCYSTGSVGGVGFVGGLVGLNDGGQDILPAPGTVSDSYSDASVSGEWSTGGLVGNNGAGTLTRSYSTGDVTGRTWIGGLVGANGGPIYDCYCVGSVTGDVSVGGLVGQTWGIVSNSYYNYDEVLINGEKVITIGALFGEEFEEWLANDKFLDVNERLSEEDGYYMVNNVADFKELLAVGQNATLKFKLKNDLNLVAEPNFYIPYLAGEVDGDGHRILNLSFNFDFVSQVGLFGYLASDGKISQVGIENMNITGGRYIGGLVGYNDGTMSSSYSSGSVTGALWIGGLVGHNDGTVSTSYSTSNVTGDSGVGGLVGHNYGTVSTSYSTSNVTGGDCAGGLVGETWSGTVSDSYSTGSVTGSSSVGGLVGYNRITVSDSYSTGNVIGNLSTGGLVGANEGFVSNSYSTGNVTGYEDAGGLVGANEGYVSNSYSTGSVIGNLSVGGLVGANEGYVSNSYSIDSVSGHNRVGGLVGYNEGTVSNSYSSGSVTGALWVGGLVGRNNGGTVTNSYAIGEVTGDDGVGGLVGFNDYGQGGTVTNSFWDIETSGQSTSDGGIGKNTTEMKNITTFTDTETEGLDEPWDITTVGGPGERNPVYIWNIVDEVTYPFLRWQPVSQYN